MRKIHNELDVEEDMPQQRRAWKVERIGWVLMFLFVAAAVLGFTGRGGLGVGQKKEGGADAGLEVEYERFLRQEAPSEMRVTFHRQGQRHRLRLSKEFVEKVRIEQIVPQPSESEIDSSGVTYTFSSRGAGSEVFFYLQPRQTGRLHTALSDGTSSLAFNQFVYP